MRPLRHRATASTALAETRSRSALRADTRPATAGSVWSQQLQPDDVGAGDELVVVLSTLTSLNGSRRSAHGNTNRNSNANTATRSTALPANLPGRPPGRRRQIQTYISRLRASVGHRLCQRSREDA